ncbi:hypothetical protein [Cyanobium sp. AMD-g]|uniref:hypothetical protein n=1 Tax=Cyanobium sp. AMD-g TaxID=2823699 RepID=UPI0037C04F2D
MLGGRCSDAQAGAFLIAHRLRRPEPQELAGLLDGYRHRGGAAWRWPDAGEARLHHGRGPGRPQPRPPRPSLERGEPPLHPGGAGPHSRG